MKAKASAFAPGHVTGFFAVSDEPQGSTGAGFCVELGVKTEVKVSPSKEKNGKLSLLLNSKKEDLPTSREVVRRFLELLPGKSFDIEISHKAGLPVGFGFGMSGAGALSLALALNKALKAKLTELEAARMAHEAEIECGTGLGSVIAERLGGFGVRKEAASFDAYDAIPFKQNLAVVLAPMRPISTAKIIHDEHWKERIGGIGSACVRDIAGGLNPDNFMKLSRLFATESGLARGDVLAAMRESNGSMAMLGESVFVLTETPKRTASLLKKYCKKPITTKISRKGARLLR
ncbi:MAG: hypothetical protein WC759_01890 [Candidatus Micrarchaeia archaeon]|jgi:pantoate kinase